MGRMVTLDGTPVYMDEAENDLYDPTPPSDLERIGILAVALHIAQREAIALNREGRDWNAYARAVDKEGAALQALRDAIEALPETCFQKVTEPPRGS